MCNSNKSARALNPVCFGIRKAIFGVLALTAASLSVPAHAATWLGTVSSDWFDANNWQAGLIPTAIDTVTLDPLAPNAPAITGSNSVVFQTLVAAGLLTIDGPGSSLIFQTQSNGVLALNNTQLVIENGAHLSILSGSTSLPANQVNLATDNNAVTGITVTGNGSQLDIGALFVGYSGHGDLTISDGATVTSKSGYIAGSPTSTGSGTAVVTGAGSNWNVTGQLQVNKGTMAIADGAVVNSTGLLSIGNPATLTVSGAGSSFTSGASSIVNGGLNVLDGAVVTLGGTDTMLGFTASSANILVSGANSLLTNAGTITMATGKTLSASMTVADSGRLTASAINLATGATSVATLNIGNGDLAGTLVADKVTGGPGTAVVNFNHTDDIDFAPILAGKLTVNQLTGGTTRLLAANTYSGATTINAGTLQAGGAGVFSTASDYTVGTAGTLDLAGYDQTLASLSNAGVVKFHGVPGTLLTVNGDYTGNNGVLSFNSVLNDDTSATDKLVVQGNTSGTTLVSVTNAGGSGATTLNGIELIEVNGISDGEFTKSGRIVAGAYDYSLIRGTGSNAGNWYLTSEYVAPAPEPTPSPEPGPNPEPAPAPEPEPSVTAIRPEASGYASNLAAANNMFVTRLHDRLGETQYVDALTGEQKVTSMWLRNEGGHNRSRDASGQLSTQANRYVMQLGGDIAQWSNNNADRLHLGVMAGYANSKSRTSTNLTGYSSNASIDGYSTGVYGTWYANDAEKLGYYVDSWLQYSWFNNTVDGQSLHAEDYKSKGFTASVESGYTFKLGESQSHKAAYFIQPQAQVTWMGVKADDHTEANGTHISGEGNGNIQTRLGVKAFMKGFSEQDKGKERMFQPFVEANWIHNTKDFGTMLDNVTVKQDGAANIGELKLGAEGQLNKQVNLWGNVGQQVGNKGYSDTAVMLGVKYNF